MNAPNEKQLTIVLRGREYSFLLNENDPRFSGQLKALYSAFERTSEDHVEIQLSFSFAELSEPQLQVLKKLKKLCEFFSLGPSFSKISSSYPVEKSKGPSRVLFVDDSPTMHKLYEKLLKDFSEDIEDVHIEHPKEALKVLEKEKFDAYVFDFEMPELTGVQLFDEVKKNARKPTLFITSLSKEDCPSIVRALQEEGGFDYLQKPKGGEIEEFRESFGNKIKYALNLSQKPSEDDKSWKSVHLTPTPGSQSLIAIGTSTGGPQTVRNLLSQLRGDHPPIVICQHMPANFVAPFAKNIADDFGLDVKIPKQGDRLEDNKVYVCAGDLQTTIITQSSGPRFKVSDDPPMNRFRPSVDYLFFGLAKLSGIAIHPVLMTGMGRDGAEGLLQLKNRGHPTIAQDEETSIVYGMPKEARELGAVDKSLADEKIMEELAVALKQRQAA